MSGADGFKRRPPAEWDVSGPAAYSVNLPTSRRMTLRLSHPEVRHRINVRSGQYYIWTPAWFYTEVDESGVPVHELTRDLIGWVDGTIEHPSVPVPEIVVASGDIPLCAMQAIRPQGDFSPIQSFAPENPCNGWYEYIALGEETYQPCDETSQCDGAEQDDEGEEIGEQCRFGFCEAY